MQTLAQLRERHAAELAKAERELAIAEQLPMPPHNVMLAYSGHYWATYRVTDTTAVANIIRQFAPLIIPTVELRDGCLYRVPLDLLPARARAKADAGEGSECVFSLDTAQGAGYGVTVKFYFFIRLSSGVIVRISCDLPDTYRAGAKLRAARYERGRLIQEAGSDPNPILRGLFHDFVRWSPNEAGKDARYTYTLCDDGPEYTETLNLLEQTELADFWKAGVWA
jgi:hypothetical protein